jgi:hypothetical protein
MTPERFKKIYEAVVVHRFYEVSNDAFLESDILHSEMVELMELAKKTFEEQA